MDYECWLLSVSALARAAGFKALCTKPGAWWYAAFKSGVTPELAVVSAGKEG